MRSFRDTPIGGKLIAIITVTCGVALLLGGVALTARYAATEQHRLAERLSVLVKITASNSRAAVAFEDSVAASEILAALIAEPSVRAAYLFDRKGSLISRFSPSQPAADPPNFRQRSSEDTPVTHGLFLLGSSFSVAGPIVLDGEEIGTVIIDADLRPLRRALVHDVGILGLIILAAGLLAFGLSTRLQKLVSAPIRRLAGAIQRVSALNDYELQVQKDGEDEIGQLIDGFNDMLVQIRQRDEQLLLAANALENTGDAIMITDARLHIVSVNKAFTAMTGYQLASIVGRRPWAMLSEQLSSLQQIEIWKRVRACGKWRGEIWGRRKSGEVYPQWLSISEVRDPAGLRSHLVFVSNDISQYKQQEARLAFLAHHDALTGLPNRALFNAELSEALTRAHRRGSGIGLMFIDLDRFKAINDSLGHAIGDELLVSVAGRIKGCLRESDIVARQGGDEFTALLDDLRDPLAAAGVADKIIGELRRTFRLSGHEVTIGASIGIACYPQDGLDSETLLTHADEAMYRAKVQGRNDYRFYSHPMNQCVTEA